MRQRLAKEKPSKGLWDLKLSAGGLVDMEFIVQQALLSMGVSAEFSPLLPNAISMLESAGRFDANEADTLQAAYAFISSLQQIQRIAVVGDVQPETASSGLKDRLQRAVKMPNFETLEAKLIEHKRAVEAIRVRRIGEL